MYRRSLQPVIREMLAEFRIVYLTGPRQSGKTTLARAVAAETEMDYVSFDDQAARAAAESDPGGFIRSFGDKRVAFDEFQYVPALIPAIKETSDALGARRGKFLLTGSADIFRSAKAQEALPGHIARLELMPLSLAEFAARPRENLIDRLLQGDPPPAAPPIPRQSIARLILNGGYPEVQSKGPRARQVWYKSYLEGRLYKDFETLYAARGDYRSKLQALARHLAGLSGNLLKYGNIAAALELDDRLAKNYTEILDLMFIIRRVPAWRKSRAAGAVIRMPKLHYADTGLACHLLGLRGEEQALSSRYYGGLFESMVYMECYKHAAWAEQDIGFYYFRDRRKHEVDIVLERADSRVIGVEAKASATVGREDFHGLAKLAEYAGELFERGVLIYTGREALPFKCYGRVFHALPLGGLVGGLADNAADSLPGAAASAANPPNPAKKLIPGLERL